ncbi:MAG: glucosaminidase domain-containing protein [Chitinophagaceae bacterium]|nr:glucosaminidase domain-containing protein [Chitinophagaceae bacterium]
MIKLSTFITTLILLSASLTAVAQNENQRAAEYIKQYKQIAIDEMVRTGVPASITLAQGVLETGGGQSDLASIANNHFGIKCKSGWNGETYLHDDDAKNECFRKYPTVEASFRDHSDFLRLRPNYAFLFKLDPTDYEGWAKGLKKAGYATNPMYSQKLLKIIVENNLQEYTLLALQGKSANEAQIFTAKNEKEAPKETSVEESTESAKVIETVVTTASQGDLKPMIPSGGANYEAGKIFVINDARVLYAPAGTSLFALANEHNISYKKLLDFNDLPEMDIINNDQLVFLQKKPKRGRTDIHIVQANENLHQISQTEGIQLASVLEFNRLAKGMQPARGEKLYLKYPAPASPKLASNSQTLALAATEMR